MNVELSI